MAPEVVGSSPIAHPSFFVGIQADSLNPFFFARFMNLAPFDRAIELLSLTAQTYEHYWGLVLSSAIIWWAEPTLQNFQRITC